MRPRTILKVLTLLCFTALAVWQPAYPSASAQAQPAREPQQPKAAYSAPLVQMPRAVRVPPASDNFANALPISAMLPTTATLSNFDEASEEAGEPTPSCQSRDVQTVWFSYTPSANQVVTFDLRGSTADIDTVAALYTGTSVNGLTEVACNDDFDLEVLLYPYLKAVTLTAGTTYYLQVAPLPNAPVAPGASVTVEVYVTPAPLNVTVNTGADTRDALSGDGFCADSGGMCSLRAAIMEANAALSGSVIAVPAGTYTYTIPNNLDDDASTDGDLDINENMTLVGAGPDLTLINAAGIDRVFQVLGSSTVSISGMTVTGGVAQFQGGGIRVDGPNTALTLSNMVVINNRAGEGAGIDVQGATLNISSSSVAYNTTPVDSFGGGGGISLFSYTDASLGLVSATLSATNVTVSNNSARQGGGVAVNNDSFGNLNFVTLASNRAYLAGGGLWVAGTGQIQLGRSLIANNTADSGTAPDCSGTYSRFALNLVRSVSGCTVDVNDLRNADPLLRPLETKGPNYTYTHGLQLGSPAIDRVGCGSVVADQRGVGRPIGVDCDLGAAEHDPRVPTLFSLLTPLDDTVAASTGSLGAFSWTQSSSDVYGYNFIITRLTGTPTVVYNSVVRGSACAGGVCSFTPPNLLLADGQYSWTVRASYDGEAVGPSVNRFDIDQYAAFPNLLINPSFEQRHTGWVRANVSGDAAKCSSELVTFQTADGSCTFRFKGSANEFSLLRQRISVDGLGLQANDRLRFSMAYLAGDNTDIVIKLVVTYKLARFTPSVVRIHPVNSGGEYTYDQAEIILKDRRVQSVRVVLRHRNRTGLFFVDDMRVIRIPAGQ